MIVVTGATGHLGQLVVAELLKTTDPRNIVAAVRTPARARSLSERGVQVREADYARPATLSRAFEGASKLLLISTNDLGEREVHHKAVIDAAKAANVQFFAYTSFLHCGLSPMLLAAEHSATEQHLKSSGLAYCLLRNGWYLENEHAAIAQAVQSGVFIGASGEGRIAGASRADLAAAAAAVLTGDHRKSKVLELAGDEAYTRAELAAEVSRQSGKAVEYRNLSKAEYSKVLSAFLPPLLADAVADAEANAAQGALDDRSRALSSLIGRRTTSLAEAVESALRTA